MTSSRLMTAIVVALAALHTAPIAFAQTNQTLGAMLQACGSPSPSQPSQEYCSAAITYMAVELTGPDGWTCSDRFYNDPVDQTIAAILSWLRAHTEKHSQDAEEAIVDAFVANYGCHS